MANILYIHINLINQAMPPVVSVVVDRGEGFWKAYQNNTIKRCGYPLHDTDNLNNDLFAHIANTGIALSKDEACRIFRDLWADKCENE